MNDQSRPQPTPKLRSVIARLPAMGRGILRLARLPLVRLEPRVLLQGSLLANSVVPWQ
jgi:hypothetical protein